MDENSFWARRRAIFPENGATFWTFSVHHDGTLKENGERRRKHKLKLLACRKNMSTTLSPLRNTGGQLVQRENLEAQLEHE